MPKTATQKREVAKRKTTKKRGGKRDYVPLSEEERNLFKQAIEKSGLNLSKITRKYFLNVCTPQTLKNLIEGWSKKTEKETYKRIGEFCSEYLGEDTKERSEDSSSVTSMHYQTVNVVEIMEKMIVVRSIANSDLDNEVKLAVIQDAVKSC